MQNIKNLVPSISAQNKHGGERSQNMGHDSKVQYSVLKADIQKNIC